MDWMDWLAARDWQAFIASYVRCITDKEVMTRFYKEEYPDVV